MPHDISIVQCEVIIKLLDTTAKGLWTRVVFTCVLGTGIAMLLPPLRKFREELQAEFQVWHGGSGR